MQAYPNYKDSGVPWLEQVPEHWEAIKTKHLFRERVQKGYPNEPLLAATQTKGVVPKTMYENKTVEALKDLHLLKLVKPGDFVISLRSFQGGIEYTYYRGIISPAYTVMIPNQRIIPEYYKYLAKSKDFISLLQTCVTGIREGQNINYEVLRKTPMPIPSQAEQKQISRYLDWQTTKINKFIKVKKRLIALLRMQTEVLAFGKQDNSQISVYEEWRNLFPKHWNFEKAKRVFVEINIKNNENKELLAVTQDRGVLLKSMCTQNYVSPAGSVSGLKLVRVNDFVISLRSFQGGIEFSEYEGIVSPAYTVMSLCDELNSEKLRVFYRVLFKSKNFIRLLNTVISGIRDGKNISFADFSKLEIPIPPVDELNELLEAFNRHQRFEMISNREIELIQEYRTRLVSDVVTGKVDVRSVEIPDFEPAPADLEVQDDEASEDELITEGIEE